MKLFDINFLNLWHTSHKISSVTLISLQNSLFKNEKNCFKHSFSLFLSSVAIYTVTLKVLKDDH